jgi:hypothetical protein
MARTVALTGQAVAERISKTGGTPYRCTEVRTRVDPGLSLSAAAINSMRRDALNQLTALRARREQPTLGKPLRASDYPGSRGIPGLTIQITSRDQLTQKMLSMEAAMLYIPMHILLEDPAFCENLAARRRIAAVLPRIVHDGELAKLQSDLLTLHDETIDETKPLELFDPNATWKRKTVTDFVARPLLVPIFLNGELVYDVPTIEESRAYCARQVDSLWDEVKRFENPHTYYVDLSQKLWDIKQELLRRNH